jgi:UDP-glucuronate 4-epimerase
MKILITGVAGFIGFHLCKRLLERGDEVIGIDNLNDYYDPHLKLARLNELGISGVNLLSEAIDSYEASSFIFYKADITDDNLWDLLATKNNITSIIHLAAQAGVRYSLENPKSYIKTNIEGFLNVLEFCRYQKIDDLIYASSSSVYGIDSIQPFSEDGPCNKPVSLYAATKRSNELMAFTYHHLFGINSMGLRFFTVYGPWGRPDMAPYLFVNAAYKNEKINVFNNGDQKRDFTYIDDIIEGIFRIFNQEEKIQGAEIMNIGQGSPVSLMDFILEIEKASEKELFKEFVDAQSGDVVTTYADTSKLENRVNYKPCFPLEIGIKNFVDWFKSYYSL